MLGMAHGSKLLPPFLIAGIVLGLAPGLSGAFSDVDQASLLYGAVRLAQGEGWSGLYNAGSQFVTYLLHAGVHRLDAVAGRPLDPVTLSNATTFLLFWGSLAALILHRRPGSGTAVLVAATLLAPILLLHSAFLSSAFTSAAFLTVLMTAWSPTPAVRRRTLLAVAVGSFLATGARADAVLALPFMSWLAAPDRSLKAWLGSARTWCAAAGALAALAVGILIQGGMIRTGDVMIFRLPVVVAYLVFGLGMALVVWLVLATRLWTATDGGGERWFRWGGAVAFLLPVAYYTVHLYSPRYLLLPVLLSLFALVEAGRDGAADRVRADLRRLLDWGPHRVILQRGLLVLAIVPLLAGVRLPAPAAPSLTLTRPTCLPSADGLLPMGCLVRYVWHRENSAAGFMDHNAVLGRLARRVRYEADPATGAVTVPYTPMCYYLHYAIAEQGLRVRSVNRPEVTSSGLFYADSRSLVRPDVQPMRVGSGARPALGTDWWGAGLRWATPPVDGLGIVAGGGAGDAPEGAEVLALLQEGAREFGGDDFRIFSYDTETGAAASRLVFAADGRRVVGKTMPGGRIALLVSVLPAYMTVKDW